MRRPSDNSHHLVGALLALGAYLVWGFIPLFWRQLIAYTPIELNAHRATWSFLILLLILAVRRRLGELSALLRQPRSLGLLAITAMLILANWSIYIWAVNHGHILDTSLGYFINPLVMVLLGVVFLRERLRPLQTIAVALATVGVLEQIVVAGIFPWIGLALSVTFGLYGLLRKRAAAAPLIGLTVETAFIAAPGAIFVLLHTHVPQAAPPTGPTTQALLLVAAGVITAFPFLAFIEGVRRLKLSTIGFFQYLTPICSFSVGHFFYGEPLGTARLIAFGLIWIALGLFTVDSLRSARTLPTADASSQVIDKYGFPIE